jgi:ABC-2 type transport system permease protein
MKATRIMVLAKKDLKRLVREPASLFMLLIFPLVLTLAFGVAFGGIGSSGPSDFQIGLANLDSGSSHPEWTNRLIGNLTSTDGIVLRQYNDNATGQSDLIQGNLDAFIVIPSGFGNSCESFWAAPTNASQWTNTTIGLYVDSGSLIATSAVPAVVQQVLLRTIFGNVQTSVQLPVGISNPALIAASTYSQWDFMAPGMFAFAAMFMTMTVAQSMTTERDGGLLKRLAATPMTNSEYMISQTISNMAVAILQVIIIFLSAFSIGYRPATNAAGLAFAAATLVAFSLVTVGFGLIAATISKSADVATGAAFIFIMPQMFLGSFIPLGGLAETVGAFMPSKYVTDALTTLFLRGAPIATLSIWIDFAIVLVTGVIVVLLGILMFGRAGRK